MEQSDRTRPDKALAVMYAVCSACGFMGRVLTVDEGLDNVFDEARAHALGAHGREAMRDIEIVWDVIPVG
ncbi:hypothetical protein [Streptomyces sp. Act143]|uniref:hypothetical protein n=1 Tax=Streptomyces sp. Act143 TaxID=2200760 RepID=UPI0011B51C4A|nr:hypothetical protein [Streptomyces sp. Act143]